jgi:acetylornithine deacetylase/succinyl-diaminopimelate desuccinylase-like protein
MQAGKTSSSQSGYPLTNRPFCYIIRAILSNNHVCPSEVFMPQPSSPIYDRPAELLQNLIRFDTTNPPGNELLCIQYISGLLNDAGIPTTFISRTPNRPNLVARLKGEGRVPPLLLYGHVDVVTTAGQKWTHPPFEARLVDGYIWGRGALDMKHGLAMYLAAILKARAEGLHFPGDIIFLASVDEEAASEYGAKFLVEQHAELFAGVHYALSEFGGASITLAGKRFYPIRTSEKQLCPTRITFSGLGGHGGLPVRGGAMAKLSRALRILDTHQLPVHIIPESRQMVEAIAAGMGGIVGLAMRQLLNPRLTNSLLRLIGSSSAVFSPLLHNSVSPTMLKASEKRNVIPSEVSLELDGRILPGFKAQDLELELVHLLGNDCSITASLPFPGLSSTDMGLFELLSAGLRELDPQGIPVPFINFGVSDARFFSILGIQTYGFTPLLIPEGLDLTNTIHAADERVPAEALDFGLTAILNTLQRFQ